MTSVSLATRYCLPNGSTLFQDSGFQGFSLQGINIIQPKKKPKGRDLLKKKRESSYFILRGGTCDEWYQKNRIVKDKLRNSKKGFSDLVMETCCYTTLD